MPGIWTKPKIKDNTKRQEILQALQFITNIVLEIPRTPVDVIMFLPNNLWEVCWLEVISRYKVIHVCQTCIMINDNVIIVHVCV
jgi:hypothetical protein